MLNLSLLERRKIARLLREGRHDVVIAARIGRSAATVRREIKRGGGKLNYDSERAHADAYQRQQIRIAKRKLAFERKKKERAG